MTAGRRSAASLTREQILSWRRRVGGLDRRSPPGPDSVRLAAWAGLQDSVPRAAVLSLHARVEDTGPDDWAHPSLLQVWGPRYSAFVVHEHDVAPFTLGRMPTDDAGRRRAEGIADLLERFLDGRRMTYRAAGEGLGMNPNGLRYAAPTGRLRLRWEGSGQPEVWVVDPPELPETEARKDLARRFVHVFGPASAEAFAQWAGVTPRAAAATFEDLADELEEVTTPIGTAWMLSSDVDAALDAPTGAAAPARLLPSGDAYFLRWGVDRELIVSDTARRAELWTSRVWPGAVLVDGEIVGTWRRTKTQIDVTTWRRLTSGEAAAVEAEAATLPIPDAQSGIETRWLRT